MSDRAAEREIRELYEAWFRAASARDLEGSMAPFAQNVVSYEHEAPLEYEGAEAVRANVERGFSSSEGELRWDVPDLHVIVRGDIAVTWGLNRTQVRAPGGPKFETWSRGTRVFQKIDGKWQLIHQHVSFPYDPETGEVRTDLKP